MTVVLSVYTHSHTCKISILRVVLVVSVEIATDDRQDNSPKQQGGDADGAENAEHHSRHDLQGLSVVYQHHGCIVRQPSYQVNVFLAGGSKKKASSDDELQIKISTHRTMYPGEENLNSTNIPVQSGFKMKAKNANSLKTAIGTEMTTITRTPSAMSNPPKTRDAVVL